MEIDPEFLKKLIETFSIELDEQSHVMTEGLLKLEKQDLDSSQETQLIDSIFRAAHNIKGSARGIGANSVGELAHHVESLFSALKNNALTINANLIDLCLAAVDAMHTAMEAFINNTSLPTHIEKILEDLKNFTTLKQDTLQNTSHPYEGEDLSKKNSHLRENTIIYQKNNIQKNQFTSIEDNTIRVSLRNLDRVSALMEEIQVNKIAINEHYGELTKLASQAKQLADTWQELTALTKSAEETDASAKLKQIGADYLHEFSENTKQLYKQLRPRINELTLLTNSLQDEIRMLRLVPVSTILSNFPRLIRDLAHELNKNVELKITGDQVKMDKNILEGLKDPLIHLLRNAIDHGIADEAIRKKRHKSPVGNIRIDIIDEGNQVLFNVTDDGAGIDVKQIADIALKKKILSPTELSTMSQQEILDLIFRPGFSSREIITDVSGRGIGLDVVKANVSNLKGTVSVSTEVSKYTTFHLRVPLTLSSERGLFVKSSDQLFVIPTHYVDRVLTLKSSDIIDVETTQAILFENHAIPLRTLAHILRFEKTANLKQPILSIVVIREGLQRIALLVDEIVGEREMIIKPLQAPLNKVPCVAGGTLAGNGQVIVVLNPNELINQSLHLSKPTRLVIEEPKALETKTHILVVDDSITTRTLEKNVLENKNYQVTVAVNGKEAWDLLQKQAFSLVITDVSMPIMDGFTLTERIKNSNELRNLPVIIVTSLDSEAEKKRGVEVGANAYIVKSEFESGALLEIVSQLV